MRILGAACLLLVAGACALHKRPTPAAQGLDCWPSPLSPPVLRKARNADSALRQAGEPGLVVIVDSSQSSRRIGNALVRLVGSSYGTRTDSIGSANLTHLRPGENHLRVARIGFDSWEGYAPARIGYRDTVELGLRSSAACLLGNGPRGSLLVELRSAADSAPVSYGSVTLIHDAARLGAEPLDSGRYLLAEVPAGSYQLRIMRIGFTLLYDTVTIRAGAVDTVRRTLSWAQSCDINCGETIVHNIPPRPRR